MAVTVKTVKKKKPLTLKKPGADAPAEGAVAADGKPIEGATPVAVAAAPVKPIKKASYTFAGVCAILTFIMFGVILALQIFEWNYYLAPPKGAFPAYGTLLPIPGGSSVSSVPVAEEPDFLDESEDLGEEDDGIEEVPADDSIPVE